MLVDEGLELLDEAEALALLGAGGIGRVGLSMAALPVIFPVNYALLEEGIVFRTGAGSKLAAAAAGSVVAFEVDAHGSEDRSGWSVLVVGHARVVDDEDLAARADARGLEPWAAGDRPHLVCVEPEFVSGRRIARTGPEGGPS
jgi:nitroimidazol reductase NimA-like FMN-containing flavoprotein (pyridoxamine 5'-phosphate oxidase superfamily)